MSACAHLHDHPARRCRAVHRGDGAFAARRHHDRATRHQERRRRRRSVLPYCLFILRRCYFQVDRCVVGQSVSPAQESLERGRFVRLRTFRFSFKIRLNRCFLFGHETLLQPEAVRLMSDEMSCRDCLSTGGGAIEMELSKHLRDYSRTIPGKEQLLIGAMARALEVIPRQLCDNAGFDATNILNKLRQKHATGKTAPRPPIVRQHIGPCPME